MPASKACRSCGTKKKCRGAHVYAVELDSEVLKDPDYLRRCGRGQNFNGRCFYVGKTSTHRVECRYKQHRAKKRTRRKEGATFDCTCRTGLIEHVAFHWRNGGNRWVRKWGKGLAYHLFYDRNPVKKNQAPLDAEAELAQHLRDLGYAAYTDALNDRIQTD